MKCYPINQFKISLINLIWLSFFWFSIFISPEILANIESISIEVKHITGVQNYIALSITIPPVSEKKLSLDMPNEWAGVTGLENNLSDFSKNVIYKNKKWFLQTNLNKPTTYSYKIHHNDQDWFLPKIFSDVFCLIGHTSLVLPIQGRNHQIAVKIKWHTAFPKHLIANSFGNNKTIQNFESSINLLQNALFIGGDIKLVDIYKNNLDFKGLHHFVALYPKNKNDFTLEDVIKNTVITQNNTFKPTLPDYFLSAWLSMPTSLNNKGQATHLFQSQVFFQDISFPLKENRYISFISHENLHYWIGRVLRANDEDYINLNWFFEGFTDYLSYLIAVENALLNKTHYIETFNKYLKHHYTESAHKEPFDKISNSYWTNEKYSIIPYIKGHIFAAKIDAIIRTNSNQKYNLKDVIQHLLNESENEIKGSRLNQKKILNALDAFSNQEASQLWERYFLKGKLIIPEIPLLDQNSSLEWKNGIPQYKLNS